jgi:hypothetical protein
VRGFADDTRRFRRVPIIRHMLADHTTKPNGVGNSRHQFRKQHNNAINRGKIPIKPHGSLIWRDYAAGGCCLGAMRALELHKNGVCHDLCVGAPHVAVTPGAYDATKRAVTVDVDHSFVDVDHSFTPSDTDLQ